jgi:hypothetical protein
MPPLHALRRQKNDAILETDGYRDGFAGVQSALAIALGLGGPGG